MFEIDNNIVTIVLILYVIAEAIVRITPTTKDDKVFGIVGKLIKAIFLSSNSKQSVSIQVKEIIIQESLSHIARKHPDIINDVECIAEKVVQIISNNNINYTPAITSEGTVIEEVIKHRIEALEGKHVKK